MSNVNLVMLLALISLAGWALYSAVRARPVFVVRISDGVPRADRGQVPRGFLREVAEACARHRVRHGEIRGVAADRRIDLSFSAEVPGPCRQQIRNLWGVSGWSALRSQSRG